jgi:two-component system, OmpR family, sensor histidine kinase VicK
LSDSAADRITPNQTLPVKPIHPPAPTVLPQDGSQALLAELQRQYQRSELFAEVTLKIRQSLNLNEILNTTVAEVQRILQADRVLIYQVLPDGTGKPISEAVLPDYAAILGMDFPEEIFPREYQALYAQGRVQAIADVHDPESGVAECLREFVSQFGVQAKLIVPIVLNLAATPAENQLWGLLIAHSCRSTRQWVEFELTLMQQLADQIGIAIAQGELLGNLATLVATRTTELRQTNAQLQQEIADRIEAETALRRSEEQLRLITDALPVLIAYVDAQQRYQFNNAAYHSWLGKLPAKIQGKTLKQVWGNAIYPQMQPWLKTALAGETVNYETEIQLRDGRTRSVDITYIPHQDDSAGKLSAGKLSAGNLSAGKIKGCFALISDISDRKAIERMKDEFISVVSHELRTPLTSIHSALKILATGRLGNLSADGQQMLGIADENTDRLVRLVNNVLDLQRIEAGAVTMDRQVCNAAELMVKAIEAMQAMAQQHDIQLTTQPVDLPLVVDPDYIVQALTNLLSNAIKFSPPQTTVTLRVQPPPEPPAMVTFQIQDQGQGIPQAQLERIFERFHQVDSSDARKKGGTGLGLTICRKIIEQHNGRIWVESIEGQGSTFSFTLPLRSPWESATDES